MVLAVYGRRVQNGGRTVALLTSANPGRSDRLESWQCRTGDTAVHWAGWFDHVFWATGNRAVPVGREATRRLVETYRR